MNTAVATPSAPRSIERAYRATLIFALVLMVFPAGCCFVDISMYFIEGFGAAVCGIAIGLAANNTRGIAAAAVCGALGTFHFIWINGVQHVAGLAGFQFEPMGNTVPVSQHHVVLEHVVSEAGTAVVFGIAASLSTLSVFPLLFCAVAGGASAGFLLLQELWIPSSPLGGLWPSGLGVPASWLFLGLSSGLYVALRRHPKELQLPGQA